MKKLTTILQLPIMEILNGKKAGQTKDIIMNPDTKDIVFVLDESLIASLYVIKGEEIMGIGKDVILIKTVQSIQNSQANAQLGKLLGEYYSVMGLDVITMNGNNEGKVVDLTIDETEKKIVNIELENGRTFDVSKIVSLSHRCVFVQDAEGKESVKEPELVNAGAQSTKESEKAAPAQETDYLIGMVLNEDVANEDGTFILKKETLLTKELISLAKEQGVLTNLIMNAE